MRKITETCRGAWASVVFLVGLPFRYVQVALFAKDRAAAHQVMMTHFQRFMSICRAKLVVDGEKPPQGTGCVLCYNEASFMDVAAFGAFMWPHVDRAAAAELYGYFPFGRRALAKCGIDLVPRGRELPVALLPTTNWALNLGNDGLHERIIDPLFGLMHYFQIAA